MHAMGGAVMGLSALTFFLFRQQLPRIYAPDTAENAAVLASQVVQVVAWVAK